MSYRPFSHVERNKFFTKQTFSYPYLLLRTDYLIAASTQTKEYIPVGQTILLPCFRFANDANIRKRWHFVVKDRLTLSTAAKIIIQFCGSYLWFTKYICVRIVPIGRTDAPGWVHVFDDQAAVLCSGHFETEGVFICKTKWLYSKVRITRTARDRRTSSRYTKICVRRCSPD